MSHTDQIRRHLEEARAALDAFLRHEEQINRIAEAANLMIHAIRHGGKVLSCGNGGSLCDAMHFAEELTGRFRDDRRGLPAIAIADPSHITCVANDYGFEEVFARYVSAVGRPGDVLLAISTSGNSPNVRKAVEAARAAGMKVVGLTGRDGGQMAGSCDVEIRAPHSAYADRAQEIHIKVIHCLIDAIERGV